MFRFLDKESVEPIDEADLIQDKKVPVTDEEEQLDLPFEETLDEDEDEEFEDDDEDFIDDDEEVKDDD